MHNQKRLNLNKNNFYQEVSYEEKIGHSRISVI